MVELSSDQPITDPVLTLLVEANWDRGHLIREYTVLLDPPVYVPNQSQAAGEQVAPATGTASARVRSAPRRQSAGEAATPPPAGGRSPARSTRRQGLGFAKAAAGAGGEPHSLIVRPVKRCRASRPDKRRRRRFHADPRLDGRHLPGGSAAFERNMNLMRSGAVLA